VNIRAAAAAPCHRRAGLRRGRGGDGRRGDGGALRTPRGAAARVAGGTESCAASQRLPDGEDVRFLAASRRGPDGAECRSCRPSRGVSVDTNIGVASFGRGLPFGMAVASSTATTTSLPYLMRESCTDESRSVVGAGRPEGVVEGVRRAPRRRPARPDRRRPLSSDPRGGAGVRVIVLSGTSRATATRRRQAPRHALRASSDRLGASSALAGAPPWADKLETYRRSAAPGDATPEPMGAASARRRASSSRSTTPRGCTGTCAWSATASSSRSRCPTRCPPS
jgi:hypothetical protein